jgi:membrane fusion protein (multidrug efflux system)
MRQETILDTSHPGPLETVAYQTERSPWRKVGRVVRNCVLGLLAIAGLILLGSWIYDRFSHVYVDDARIAADVISISSRVSGWISKVHVSEGAKVKAGDILATMDDRESRLRLAELGARYQSVDAKRAKINAEKKMVDRQTDSQYLVRSSQLRAVQAALAGRQSDLDLAQTDFERTKKLLSRKVVSRQRWEERRKNFRVAEQGYQQALAEVAAAKAALVEASADRQKLLVLDRDIAALTYDQAEIQAQIDRQGLDMRDRIIRSPIDGVVDKSFVNTSEYVLAGQRLMMVHDPDKIWVSANVRETDIKHLKVGSSAVVTVDAFPDQTLKAKITRIGNAATSEFALLPTPNPSGNFTKIAQRLSIRVELDDKSDLLRPGMMVEVDIGIDDR